MQVRPHAENHMSFSLRGVSEDLANIHPVCGWQAFGHAQISQEKRVQHKSSRCEAALLRDACAFLLDHQLATVWQSFRQAQEPPPMVGLRELVRVHEILHAFQAFGELLRCFAKIDMRKIGVQEAPNGDRAPSQLPMGREFQRAWWTLFLIYGNFRISLMGGALRARCHPPTTKKHSKGHQGVPPRRLN